MTVDTCRLCQRREEGGSAGDRSSGDRRSGDRSLDAVTILTTISEIVGSGQALRPNKPERDLPPPYEEPPSYNVAIMMT